MMRLKISLLRAATLFIIGLVLMQTPVAAKGPVDKIAVEGPQPFEITEGPALAEYNPWGRGFIDWDQGLAPDPGDEAQAYDVSFYLDGRKRFVLEYLPDPANGTGYVYLPASDTAEYRLNAGTIIAGSSDHWNPNGKWQYATQGWVILMASEGQIQPPSTGDAGLR